MAQVAIPSRRGPVAALYTDKNNDPAKHARRLSDTLSVKGYIADALSEVMAKYNDNLPQCAVRDLEVLVKATRSVQDHAFQTDDEGQCHVRFDGSVWRRPV